MRADGLQPFLQRGLFVGQAGQHGGDLAGIFELLLEGHALGGEPLVVVVEFLVLPAGLVRHRGEVAHLGLQPVKLVLVDRGQLRLLGVQQGTVGLGE